MFCQLFSLQNKSFLCLQHVENKGFQTVIKHRLKAIQKPIKNELGNREKKHKKCTFRFEKMHISFSRLYIETDNEKSVKGLDSRFGVQPFVVGVDMNTTKEKWLIRYLE